MLKSCANDKLLNFYLRERRSLVVDPKLIFVVEIADSSLASRAARFRLVDRHSENESK
jgi:hypothetical protein